MAEENTPGLKWVISILTAVAIGLAGIIWANLTSQITELRADTRVNQSQVNDIRLNLLKLEERFGNLLTTLNERLNGDRRGK